MKLRRNPYNTNFNSSVPFAFADLQIYSIFLFSWKKDDTIEKSHKNKSTMFSNSAWKHAR
jgi:hypothetical protein